MTLTTPYSATFIVGDGETKTFSYLFEEVSPNFISVMVYNSLTGLISTPTYVIDTDQKQVIFGEDTPAPTADETVCIYRNTPNVQDVAFRTLHGYDAQTLENILSKIVAMIQEIKSNYFSTQVLQGDPWQLDLLSSADDGATVNIDYTAKKLVKGLYFRITSGNLQVSADGTTYITLPKSDDVAEFRQYEQTLPDLTVIRKLQYRVGNQWFDAEVNAQYTADEAYALAESVQTTMNAHINNTQNPHETSLANLTDTDLSGAESGQFLQFDGVKWKAVYSTASVSWGGILGNINDQADLQDEFDTKVSKSGDTMTGALSILRTASSNTSLITIGNGTASSRRWNFLPSYNVTSLSVYSGTSETGGYRFTLNGFVPASNNVRELGSSSLKWKAVYAGMLNNGANLVIPNKAGTLATMDDVELAAQSGTQLYPTGVWYAKMYRDTVVPSGAEYDGRNYADFSQVNRDSNPIIIIYEGRAGRWAETRRITPPAEYDGYITVTSKIWDISEQTGQQGGRVLWNHTDGTFTPYPLIISFEDIEVTGNSTVIMPQNPGAKQIVNKDYVDEAIAEIPTGGSGLNVGDVFMTKRTDNELNGAVECDGATYNTTDFTGAQSIGALLEAGKLDYVSLSAYSTAISTKGWCDKIGWDGTGNTQFRVPTLNAHIVQTNNIPVVGNGKSLGLTDGSQEVGLSQSSYSFRHMSASTNGVNVAVGTSVNDDPFSQSEKAVGITTDPTKSGIIADTTDTAQLRVMIQLATSTTDQALETCTSVLADVATLKSHEVIAFQAPTADNNYTWYRKYADGWVEQGGIVSGAAGDKVVTFLVVMADTNYMFFASAKESNASAAAICAFPLVNTRTTTGMTIRRIYNGGNAGETFCWEVKGMAQG